MRITVDRDRCEGHGVCESAAPELFRIDDEGDLIFPLDGQELPARLHTAATDSVLICPVAALKLEG
jgi:ferredoxin